MKGLILSITAGQGHNQTAKVLSDCFNAEGIECLYMDSLKYINPLLSESVSKIYLMSTKSIPKIYGKIYRRFENRPVDDMHGLPKLTNNILARALLKKLHSENPDFIICTHVFAALLVTALKGYISDDIMTVGIVTDFTIHPYWEDTHLDYYVTPSEGLNIQALKKGIPENRILPFGIPIDPKFSKRLPREKACEILGIDDRRTVLVMSGSMGFGNVTDEIKALDRVDGDFQIVTICGNNKKLKKHIDNIEFSKKVYNYGFVNNVDVFMDAVDCIITKPGGLTTSEALAKGVPMIMSNPIPGQEDRNVEFLLNAGAAIKVSPTYPIDDAIYQLFSGKRLKLIKEAIRSLGKPNATKHLVEFIADKA